MGLIPREHNHVKSKINCPNTFWGQIFLMMKHLCLSKPKPGKKYLKRKKNHVDAKT